MINRAIAPEINSIEKIEIIRASEKKLSNGMSLYTINAGTQDILKVELLFNAGMWHQSAPLVAGSVNDLIDEGTSTLSSMEIAERMDYFGAYLETDCSHDFATVNVYTLSKHLDNVLPVIEEMVKNAAFPEKEFSTHVQNKRQKFRVDEQKVQHVARERFNECLFGTKHPYGMRTMHNDFERLKREQLIDFHQRFYSPENCRIIVSGKVNDEALKLLEKHFGNWKVNVGRQKSDIRPTVTTAGKHFVEKKDAIQSAIRVGRTLFQKTHPDYLGMTVLNTILGGYFGSRLMSNIREEKGYTYGIGSGVISLSNGGYFFISTEVGVDVCSKAIDEIYFEMKRLSQEKIAPEEMELVRNYMLGTFLGDIDGPFHLASVFKAIMVYDLDYDYYDNYIRTIRTISSEDIMQLADQYLRPDDMVEIIVGKK